MQQQDHGRVSGPGLPVEDPDAPDISGTVVDGLTAPGRFHCSSLPFPIFLMLAKAPPFAAGTEAPAWTSPGWATSRRHPQSAQRHLTRGNISSCLITLGNSFTHRV